MTVNVSGSLSYTLMDLQVETDYTVTVTATNECGDESPPSTITVRIDVAPSGILNPYVRMTCLCIRYIILVEVDLHFLW